MYGAAESWALTEAQGAQLETFHNGCPPTPPTPNCCRYGININNPNNSAAGDMERQGVGASMVYNRDSHSVVPLPALEYLLERVVRVVCACLSVCQCVREREGGRGGGERENERGRGYACECAGVYVQVRVGRSRERYLTVFNENEYYISDNLDNLEHDDRD